MPDWLLGSMLSVIMKGGGSILLVTYTIEDEPEAPEETLTFQTSMRSVVIGGIVRTVDDVVRVMPVEVETSPLLNVVTLAVGQPTSSDVV